ncbi:MAG: TonB-dependent receptor plug domain-containing protein [Limisphaerales bacterium]
MKNSEFRFQNGGRGEIKKSRSRFNAPTKRAPEKTIWFAAIALALANHLASAAETNSIAAVSANADLGNLSIEQLMNIKVSILGPSESISQTPAAVSVVTQNDIQRSGAMNIPEALRLVPGLDVAQLDSSQWAVSARGFNDAFANKLLVMQDGRSIYTPLFSGVFWDVQGTMMEDIDHIEVVRGPGATLWGANAMNGVINILTKDAEDTQGLLVSGGGGNQDRGFASARYGGKINDDAYYRVYGTYENHDSTELPDGGDANNSWQLARAGFRTDWKPPGDNSFTFQGDGYASWIDQVFGIYDSANPPTWTDVIQDQMKADGANVLGRWTHAFSDTANFKLQAYYDYTARDVPQVFDEQRHTVDLDFKHEFAAGDRNKFVWGLGYRLTTDTEKNNSDISFSPEDQTVNLFSAFAQDEIAIMKDRLSLTLGSKFEDNDYTGFEIEPGARLLWTPTEHQTFWASVSRAVRTPSRAEETISLTQARQVAPGVYFPVTLLGADTFESENLIAYEIGYRAQPFERLSFDLAAFFNHYDDLRSQQPDPARSTPGHPYFDLENDLYGDTYGAEATVTWRVMDWWRLQPGYTLLHMRLHARADSNNQQDAASVAQIEGSSPQNQFSIRSSMDLPNNVTFDTALRYVDNLPYFDIESYFELDARLAWKINSHWEIAIVGQNLLHDRHAEFGPSYINTQNGNVTDIPRSIFGKVTWQF